MNLVAPYHLHPMVVHFPIAFLIGGFALHAARGIGHDRPGFAEIEAWLLWIGTVTLWLTVGLGLLAENTAPHVPSAWQVLRDHKTFAFSAAFVFTGLSVWRRFQGQARAVAAFSLAWAIAVGLLITTSHHGAQLLFRHGMGVLREF